MRRVSARLEGIAPSATLAVTAKAAALKAAGTRVIGFGAGEPDFPTPAHIVEAAAAATRDPAMHRYTASAGLPALRSAIAEVTGERRDWPLGAADVVVTNGGKQAVYMACAALCDPGDEVLLPGPCWVTYPEAVRLAGGVPVEVPTTDSTGFMVDPDMLERHTTARTKALIFVSPSNPTGAVYPPSAVAEIARWATERGIWVISDEIYEHLVYGDAEFSSPAGLVPEARDTTILVNGVAKTYAMTGWRVGWLVGPRDVVAAVDNLQSHLTSNVANVAQVAALAALTGPQDAVATMREAFDRRRRTIVAALAAIDGVTCAEPDGAFYVFPNFSAVLGTSIGGRRIDSTLDLADVLLDAAGVAIVPGEAFGAPGYARLSYALGDDDLDEGVARIAAALT